MSFVVLPALLPANVNNAPENARIISEWIRGNDVEVHGRQRSGGHRCSMCNREPPSGELYEIIQSDAKKLADQVGVRIGIDVCRKEHLLPAIYGLLGRIRRAPSPDPAAIKRLCRRHKTSTQCIEGGPTPND